MQPVSLTFSSRSLPIGEDFPIGLTFPSGIVILQADVDFQETDALIERQWFTKREKRWFCRTYRKHAKKVEHSGMCVVNPRSKHWIILIAIEHEWAPIKLLSHEIYHLVRALTYTPWFIWKVKFYDFKGEELEARLYDALFCTIYRRVLTQWPQWFDPRERWVRDE